MATKELTAYQSLLVDYTPRPIRTETAYKRALRQVERLMKPRLGRAEAEIVEMLATLIEQYESKRYPTPKCPPGEMLAFLVEERGITRAMLARETGIKRSSITDIIAGRRSVSTANVAKLSEYFGVSADLFIANAS